MLMPTAGRPPHLSDRSGPRGAGLSNADLYQSEGRTSAVLTTNTKENPMCALTAIMTHYLVTPFRRTRTRLRTRLQLLARSDAGYALRAAVTTLVLAITGGLEHLVDELRLTWNRLRLLSRDEAGYTTLTVIIVALLVVIAIAAGAILYTQVISKAIHTRRSCDTGRPCG
jgi:hypothetical protein